MIKKINRSWKKKPRKLRYGPMRTRKPNIVLLGHKNLKLKVLKKNCVFLLGECHPVELAKLNISLYLFIAHDVEQVT